MFKLTQRMFEVKSGRYAANRIKLQLTDPICGHVGPRLPWMGHSCGRYAHARCHAETRLCAIDRTSVPLAGPRHIGESRVLVASGAESRANANIAERGRPLTRRVSGRDDRAVVSWWPAPTVRW